MKECRCCKFFYDESNFIEKLYGYETEKQEDILRDRTICNSCKTHKLKGEFEPCIVGQSDKFVNYSERLKGR